MTRTGKIARLPREIREQLNRRLQNGETGKTLISWLNALPEAQAVLKTEFGERPISKQNLSEWKTGGYRDWVLQQETIELVRHMDADSDELSQASKTRLTDLLAQRLAARYVVVAKALSQSDTEGEIDLKLLREFCGDIVALRKGDHSAERLKLERERMEFDREQLRKLRDEDFWEWAREHRDEICQGYMTPEERNEKLIRLLFGDPPADLANGEVRRPWDSESAAPTESNQIKPDQTRSNHMKRWMSWNTSNGGATGKSCHPWMVLSSALFRSAGGQIGPGIVDGMGIGR
jgi:hypothetical protein